MVRGLDVFREHFAKHADQFVLIGGTAATLAMETAGLQFRATKDLDIVLHIEASLPRSAKRSGTSSSAVVTKFAKQAIPEGRFSIGFRNPQLPAFPPC